MRKLFQFNRPSKQLITLWSDFVAAAGITSPISSLPGGAMEAAILDPAKLKLLEVFLELCISSSQQWVPNSAPIEGDVSEIITNLLKISKYIFMHMTLLPTSLPQGTTSKVIGPTVDYSSYLQIVSDICSSILLLCSHPKFSKEVSKMPSLVVFTLEALDVCVDPENASKLVQIINILVSSNVSVQEFGQQRGYERLLAVTRRKNMAAMQLSVLTKIAEILSRYPELQTMHSFPSSDLANQTSVATGENMSQAASRSGRASPQMGSMCSSPRDVSLTHRDRDIFSTKNSISITPRPRTPTHYSLATAVTGNGATLPITGHGAVAETMASKGFKMAVNMMGGLIQMTPISTTWGRGENDAQLGKARAAVDEEALLILESLALSTDAFIDEEDRIKFLLRDKISGLDSPTADEITSTLDSLLDYKRSSNMDDSGGNNQFVDTASNKRSISLDVSENRRLEVDVKDIMFATTQQNSTNPPVSIAFNVPKLIRSQVLEQGVMMSLLESMSAASTRTQVCEVLHIAETLLHRNQAAQNLFQAQDGYVLIATMIIKVEIELLARQQMSSQSTSPTSASASTSKAFTTGHGEGISGSSNNVIAGVQKPVDTSSSSSGVSISAIETEKIEYIHSIGRSLLAIILDESFSKINLKPMPSLFSTGSTNNVSSVTCLTYLLRSKSYVALSIGVRVMFSLLKMNPTNIVMMQTLGVTEELFKTFSHLVVSGPDSLIDFERQMADHYTDASGNIEGDDEGEGRSSEGKAYKDILKLKSNKLGISSELLVIYEQMMNLVSDFSSLVQYVGVVTSYKDCSILAYLSHLVLSLTILFSENHGVAQLKCKPQVDTKKTFDIPSKVESDWYSRCQNCDIEDATVECMHESCSKLKCLKLCRECDKVFHKAVAKRAHIRVPIAENMLPETFAKLAKLENPTVATAIRETERWLEHTSQNTQKSRGMSGSFDTDFVGSPSGSIFLDSVISILLANIRGLIDDRRSRSQTLPSDLLEPVLIALRVLITIPPSFAPQCHESMKAQNLNKMTSLEGNLNSNTNQSQAQAQTQTQTQSASNVSIHSPDDILRMNRLDDDFARLADSRCDVDMSGGFDFLSSNSFESVEEECSPGSSRRVALTLFVQVITRFILLDEEEVFNAASKINSSQTTMQKEKMKDSATSPSSGSTSSVMFSFRQLGGDALLVHLLLDDSKSSATTVATVAPSDRAPFVQLITGDRQAIIWCLRECVVSANMLPIDDAAVEILRWLLWTINAPLATPKYSGSRPKSIGNKAIARELIIESSRASGLYINAASVPTVPSTLPPFSGNTNSSGTQLTRTNSQSSYSLRSRGVKFATFPMSKPPISLQLRMLIVQELRCLLSGDESDSIFTALKSSTYHIMNLPVKTSTAIRDTRKQSSSNALKQLQRTYSQESNPSVPLSRTSSWRNGVNISSQSDILNMAPSVNPNLTSSTSLLSSLGALTRVPGNASSMRALFVKAGGVETLFKITFGELSNDPIKSLILSDIHGNTDSSSSSATKTTYSGSSVTASTKGVSTSASTPSQWAEEVKWIGDNTDVLEDIHMEDWLSNLALLWEILSNNDEAKSALEQIVSLPQIISCLFSLTRDVCIDRSDTPMTGFQITAHTYAANNLLLDMIMELCITQGRCTSHRKAFVGCSLKYPSIKINTITGKSMQGQMCLYDRSMEAVLSETRTSSSNASKKQSQQQLRRPNWRAKLFQFIVKNVTAFHEFNDDYEPRSTFLASLSPMYFVKDRTLSHMVFALAPLQLAFKYEPLSRRSLLIQTTNTIVSPTGNIASNSSLNNSIFGPKNTIGATVGSISANNVLNMEGEFSQRNLAENTVDTASIASSQNRRRSNSIKRLQHSISMQSFSDLGATQVIETWENDSIAPSVQSYQSQNSIVAFANVIKSGNNSLRGDVTPMSVGQSRSNRRIDSYGPGLDGIMTPLGTVPSLRPPFTVPILDSVGWTMGPVQTKLLMLIHGALLYKSGLTASDLNIDDDDTNLPDCGDASETQTAVGDSVSVSAVLRPIQSAAIMSLPRIQSFRKQLAIFTTTNRADRKGSLLKTYDSSSTTQTAFSRLQFRSYSHAAYFLSLALSARDDSQMFLLTFLSNIVDGNPMNARMLVKESNAPVMSLIRLMPLLQEKQKTTISHLLSQFLCYHVSNTSIEQLSQVAKSNRIKNIFKVLSENSSNQIDLDALLAQISQTESTSADEDYDQDLTVNNSLYEEQDTTNQVLYVLGRSAKRKNPAQFLHFDQSSPLSSGILLSPIKSLPSGAVGYSFHCWLRLGSLGSKVTSSLMQISVRNNVTGDYEVFTLDLFFRVVYKASSLSKPNDYMLNTGRKANNSIPSFDAISSGESKRVAQLCLSLGQFTPPVVSDTISSGTNLGDKPHINIPMPIATKRVPLVASDRVQSIGSTSELNLDNRNSNDFTSTESEAIQWVDIASNIIDVQSGVKTLQESLIDKLRNLSTSDGKSTDFPDIGSLNTLGDTQSDPVYGLISSVSRCILPDAVVDFDWVENGSWHLLSFHHSDSGFVCCIDGETRSVLPWSLDSPSSADAPSNDEITLFRPIPIKTTTSDSVSLFALPSKGLPTIDKSNTTQKISLSLYPKLQPTDHMHVGLGFKQVEEEYTDRILHQLEFNATNTSSHGKLTEEYLTILQCHEVVVGGLAADIGEVCFFEGAIDQDMTRHCFTQGPDAGLKIIRGAMLVSLDLPGVINESSTSGKVNLRQSITTSGDKLVGKMTSPKVTALSQDTVVSSPKRDSGNVFSFFGGSGSSAPTPTTANTIKSGKAEQSRFNTTSKSSKDGVSGSYIKPLMQLGSSLNVQRHDTTLLSTALAQLGGLQLFYPLLLCDLPRQTAALQVLADIVASSSTMFDEFTKAQTDKVILYCCHKTSMSQSLDAMQTIFDLVCPPSKVDHDAILHSRKSILSLLLDVSLSCSFQPLTARAIVDWLKGVCDDVTENSKFVLNGFGVYPFLILLSLWSPTDASTRFLTSNSNNITDAVNTAVSPTANASALSPTTQQPAAPTVSTTAATGGESKSKLVLPLRSCVSFSTIPDLSSSSFDELTNPAIFAPVAITTRPVMRSHSAFSSELSNKHDLFKLNAEKSRLQLSCGIFIKQLMTGTSGHEPMHQPQPGHLTPFHTETGFTINHFTALLNFLHFSYQKLEKHDEQMKNAVSKKPVIDISVRPNRKTLNRLSATSSSNSMNNVNSINNINNTTKNVMAIGSAFTMPIVSNVDKSDNWLLNAILIILDSIIGAAETSLASTILDFLRIFQSNNSIWDLCLMLLGSEYSSIRYRAVTLVTMSLTLTPNGVDPDPKSIHNFEKMNGFTIMAEQLCKFPNDEAIINSLLSILFWRKGHSNPLSIHLSPIRISRTMSATNAVSVPTHKEGSNSTGQGSPVGLPQAFPFALPSPSKLSTESVANRSKLLLEQSSGNVDQHSVDDRLDSGPGSLTKQDADKLLGRSSASNTTTIAGNSSMFSIFSWKNSSSNTPRFESPTPGERSESQPRDRGSPLKAAKKLLRGDTSNRSGSPAPRLELPRGISAGADTSQVSGDTLPSQGTTNNQYTEQSQQNDGNNQGGGIEVETIVVPQIFPVLLAALQTCRSLDIIQAAIKALILAIDASARAPSRQKPVTQAAIERAVRNAEILYTSSSCKDWIVFICQAIQHKRDKILGLDAPAPASAGSGESGDYDSETGPHTRDRKHSVTSLSETESIGGEHYISDLGSEDDRESVGRSLYGDSAIDCSASVRSYGSRSLHGSRRNYSSVTLEQLETLCSKFVEPFYLLLETMLILDLKQRPTPARRWVEIFRLSAPEYEDTQRVILFDLMKSFDNFSFNQRYHSLDIVLNYFRNYASLLEQILYKSDLSLEYSVLVIKAIHAMTYKCPPEVRAKLKETGLSEVRNTYIVQCLMDCFDSHSRDLYSRATALCEINSPLQGYMTSIETKLLSSSHVVLYVLSIFVEGAEELEAASNIELSFAVSGDTNALIHRVQMLVDSMYFIIAIVQSCVIISSECKNIVTKLCKSILGDKDEYLLKVLLKSEQLILPSSLPSIGLVSGKKVSGKLESTAAQSASIPESKADNTSNDGSSSSGGGSVGVQEGQGVISTNATSTIAPLTIPSSSTSAATPASWWGSWSSSAGSHGASGEANSPKNHLNRSQLSGTQSTSPHRGKGIINASDMNAGVGNGDNNVIKPDDIPLFLDWFCAPEQKAVFEEFKMRVIREIKPVLRKTEKIHDRNTQRKIKHIRGEMERVLKDHLAIDKLVREGKEKMKKTTDRSISSFNQDAKTCMDNVAMNLDVGRAELKKALQVILML